MNETRDKMDEMIAGGLFKAQNRGLESAAQLAERLLKLGTDPARIPNLIRQMKTGEDGRLARARGEDHG